MWIHSFINFDIFTQTLLSSKADLPCVVWPSQDTSIVLPPSWSVRDRSSSLCRIFCPCESCNPFCHVLRFGVIRVASQKMLLAKRIWAWRVYWGMQCITVAGQLLLHPPTASASLKARNWNFFCLWAAALWAVVARGGLGALAANPSSGRKESPRHYRDTRAGSSSSFSCFLQGLPPQPWGRVQRVGIWEGWKGKGKCWKRGTRPIPVTFEIKLVDIFFIRPFIDSCLAASSLTF